MAVAKDEKRGRSFHAGRARILFEISRGEGIQASDIVERAGIDKGYLSRILERFSAKKLVSRPGFTYAWLGVLADFLNEKQLLHLLQSAPGKNSG